MKNRDEIPLDSRDYAECESEEYLSLLGSRSHQFAIRASEWALANGSPEHEGDWEFAHTPLPAPEQGVKGGFEGGGEGVWLPRDLHQIHGILQSEDTGRCCFLVQRAYTFLNFGPFCDNWFGLYDLYEKWSSVHGKQAIEKYHSTVSKEEKDRTIQKMTKRIQAGWDRKKKNPKEMKEFSRKKSEQQKSYWSKLSPEERTQRNNRSAETRRKNQEKRRLSQMAKNDPLLPDFED